ncbi:alpha/beta fold hydrolase [Spirosoma sp. KUDC1026]|uniref:alpha/beta fold hydrolase n=1 Tax=Spirosoma sp. KUDC1026 TaxID=2745947 RepID=UPI001E588246|nr:alpha/beta hydrolase [Spirosoma sp. KUDC1026]
MTTHQSTYATVPTEFITAANGITFAYRRLGQKQTVPIIYFGHLTANLDNADPSIMDALATRHEIISFDYRGVGASSGDDAESIADMAKDGLAFIKALGYEKVDILAFSMGGFITQELMALEPTLVRKLILAGTGPRGAKASAMSSGLRTWTWPKHYLRSLTLNITCFSTRPTPVNRPRVCSWIA